ncbi:sushi domain containing 2 mesh [Tachypleus tridentatus]|uniref:sushi domain containing 2 mesh n=1 Tax=Tachypleus tridentatus TaxID=6853 RepID=UPI003FD39AA3
MAAVRWFLIIVLFQLVYSKNELKLSRRPQAAGRPQFYSPVNPAELEILRKQLMYPYDTLDFKDITAGKSYIDIGLKFRLPYFGFAYHYIMIHKDGYAAFNTGPRTLNFPIKFPLQITDTHREKDPSLIAPWLSLQDIATEAGDDAGLYFREINIEQENNGTLKERIIRDFKEGMIGASDFYPKHCVIVTWKNMTWQGYTAAQANKLKTNTYQMVIATDEVKTYVMFNYEKLEWITHTDKNEGTKGDGGVYSYVGFNAGNTTRTFEFRPFSQDPRIATLVNEGYGNGLNGRYFFQVDEEIWPGACVNRELDPNWKERVRLTFFPRYGNMLGGTLVNVTGPCLKPNSVITCKFDITEVEGVYQSPNHATCISPVVMFHGYVDLAVQTDGKGYYYSNRYYVQPPDSVDPEVQILNKEIVEVQPESLTLNWESTKLSWQTKASVALHLWGFEEKDQEPSLTYISELNDGETILNDQGKRYNMDVSKFKDRRDYGKLSYSFGLISVNLTDATFMDRKFRSSPVLWSNPIPLAWYFYHQWRREWGNEWKNYMCEQWYLNEKYSDRFATTNFRCPCTLTQAELDRGRFSPDTQCNVINKNCEVFFKGAHHCVRSGRPSIGGSGQMCCYDDQNELIQTADTMYGGRPSRSFVYGKHPYKWRMYIPVLSNWLHDVMPFFYCCKWADRQENSETCDMYNYWRTSQDCSAYQPPGIASVYGDPHFLTFDRVNYTFNGRGEFVLVHVDNPLHKLHIQGRFEQVPRPSLNDKMINGTYLTAIAAMDNVSSIVEFRIRPDAARWRYHMYILVDKEYVFFWDDSMRIQNFRGVTLYQPAGITNMSHIVAMFDSGAGVEVLSDNGFMTVHVYLPVSFRNITGGLLGKWSLDVTDEFTGPNGEVLIQGGDKVSTEAINRLFGNKWRLAETEKKNIGKSLFHHDAFSFSYYDDQQGYTPELREAMEIVTNISSDKINMVCSSSAPCIYDYKVTGNELFAKMTKKHEAMAYQLKLDSSVIRCPALPRPINGRKTDNTYKPGGIVRFTCDEGYRLVGYEVRQCMANGLWSWGDDPECISNQEYKRRIAGITVGIIVPIMLILIIVVVCFIRHRKQSDSHYTGERGRPTRNVEVKTPYTKNSVETET